jgi:hypothetical protein
MSWARSGKQKAARASSAGASLTICGRSGSVDRIIRGGRPEDSVQVLSGE